MLKPDEYGTKKTAYNERFAKIAALSRIKGSGILNSPTPLKVNRLPQLRQAATTLTASGGQCVRTMKSEIER